MSAITKDQYRRPRAPRQDSVPVPENGEGAYAVVREISAYDLRDLRDRHGGEGRSDNFPFVHDLLHRVLVDDSGVQVFDSPDDVAENLRLGMPTIEALVNKAFELAGVRVAEGN